MSLPIFHAPTPNTQKLEALRQLFPSAVETDAQGRIRINAAALHTVKPDHLYQAANVLMIVKPVPLADPWCTSRCTPRGLTTTTSCWASTPWPIRWATRQTSCVYGADP